jgi:putative ABC transport system permease protein
VSTLLSDLRVSFRALRNSPAFTGIALLCLALGIGVNTTIFSSFNAMFLRPLPFEEPERLVAVEEVFAGAGESENEISYPNFLDWTRDRSVFSERAAFQGGSFNLAMAGEPPVFVGGARVSAELFDLLGIRPALGRSFRPGEDGPTREPLVILGHSLWQRQFGNDPGVLGRVLTLNGEPHTVVGVMPPGFKFPNQQELWVPHELHPTANRGNHSFYGIARLPPGITVAQANAALVPITARLQTDFPETNAQLSAAVRPYRESLLPDEVRSIILIMMAAVGFVLLIACANIANLLLARATGRRREMAVRVAIGAGRGRIIRQLLTESLVLALIGGALGVLVGAWGLELMHLGITEELLYWIRFDIDGPVLLFTLAVALGTGILFGLAPALRASRPNLHEDLKDGARGTSGGASRSRLRSGLVVGELALSVVLLVGAMLMMRSFMALQNADPGFDPRQILTMRMLLAGPDYAASADRADFVARLTREVESLPGVEHASVVTYAPLSGSSSSTVVAVAGRDYAPGERPSAAYRPISERYFETLGVPLLSGRRFTEQEVADTASASIIINDVAARRFWPDEDPLGQRLEMFGETRTVVGVVPEMQQRSVGGRSESQIFVPYGAVALRTITLLVKTDRQPEAMTEDVRATLARLDPGLPAYEVMTMERMVADSYWDRRLYGYMFATFAAIALFLAAVGVYGVMAYAVAQRTHEIGVRMAMGAEVRDVLGLVAGQTARLVGAGLALGLIGAYGVTRVLSGFLYGVASTDVVSFVTIPVFLGLVALSASIVPAMRAARLSPTVSLRTE